MTAPSSAAVARDERTAAATMLNKVPAITAYFWIIKILGTTVGETAADYLNDNLGFGLTKTTYVAGALLVVLLAVQFRLRRYVPGVYWSVVVVAAVVVVMPRRWRIDPERRLNGAI